MPDTVVSPSSFPWRRAANPGADFASLLGLMKLRVGCLLLPMKVTLELPDELAADLRKFEHQSASIVAAGLREVKSPGGGQFHGLAPVLEKLAELPSPQEVLALRPSPELQARISELLRRNCEEGLTPEEDAEWQRYETVEHLVRLAKARATAKLKAA